MTATAVVTLTITSDRALAIANADAVIAYKQLTQFRVEIRLADDGWHVDYFLAERRVAGGGPHYIISADNGEILFKRYDQ